MFKTFAAAKVLQIFQMHKIFSKKIIDLQAKRRFLGIVCARTSVIFFAKKDCCLHESANVFSKGPLYKGELVESTVFFEFARKMHFFLEKLAHVIFL